MCTKRLLNMCGKVKENMFTGFFLWTLCQTDKIWGKVWKNDLNSNPDPSQSSASKWQKIYVRASIYVQLWKFFKNYYFFDSHGH